MGNFCLISTFILRKSLLPIPAKYWWVLSSSDRTSRDKSSSSLIVAIAGEREGEREKMKSTPDRRQEQPNFLNKLILTWSSGWRRTSRLFHTFPHSRSSGILYTKGKINTDKNLPIFFHRISHVPVYPLRWVPSQLGALIPFGWISSDCPHFGPAYSNNGCLDSVGRVACIRWPMDMQVLQFCGSHSNSLKKNDGVCHCHTCTDLPTRNSGLTKQNEAPRIKLFFEYIKKIKKFYRWNLLSGVIWRTDRILHPFWNIMPTFRHRRSP